MKILVSWLNDYIEIGSDAEQIAEILSNLGLACEGIEHLGNDAVIDIEVTSNRGDCLSYIGVARELSAATGKPFNMPKVELSESQRKVDELAEVEVIEPDLCKRYTARVIEGVVIKDSPDWLKNRLEAVGLRTVNNVVDATNYAMLETGQPPHAFDYDKITDGKIIVRRAQPGERLVSIDGTKCNLNPDMLIIADAKAPVAIAGVMGGQDSEVSEKTTRILLEDAYFEPISVRTTSVRLSLPSEAAFRFERNVDVGMIDYASKRAAQLITQVAGGKVAKGVVDIYCQPASPKKVKLRLSRLKKLLGIEVPQKKALELLSRLGFEPAFRNDVVVCSVGSWRSDTYREVDLIEEVARHYGYDKIPTEKKIQIEVAPVDLRNKFTESVGAYLNGCGFYETINVGFVNNSTAELFAVTDSKKHLTVRDDMRKDADLLRQTLIGSLIGVLKTNLNVKNRPCRIFEIAATFVPDSGAGSLPVERTKLALACDSNLQDLRGVVEGLIARGDRHAGLDLKPTDLAWAQTGAEILVDGEVIGIAGIVSDAVLDKFNFKNVRPCCAEVDFEKLMALQSKEVKVEPIPRYPAIDRDLSLILEESICWTDIAAAIKSGHCDKLEGIEFVGLYRGKGIAPGKKGITISLRFRDEDGTLTHESVDGFEEIIVANLKKSLGAVLRTK
ncbi:MAG: phenylalanine--tRNA ligase subunit beta [Sedimentisphaerales bacterium]|nr:phenylalanine--tRNA ligase subunit beta [Sedimentisphaerales bacterium]